MESCSRPAKFVQGCLAQFKVRAQKPNQESIFDSFSSCRCSWAWTPWEGHPRSPGTGFCRVGAPFIGLHAGYWGETIVCKIWHGGMPGSYCMTNYTYFSWFLCLCEMSFAYSLYYWLSFLVFIIHFHATFNST